MDDMDNEIFSLPKQEVVIISKERHEKDSFLLGVKSIVIKVRCTKCGGYNTKRIGKGYNEQIVNHMFLSNYSTVKLKLHKRRFICKDCDIGENTFLEGFSFVEKNCSYTDIYAQYILREREYSSLKELSRKFKVSETLIYKVIKSQDLDNLVKGKINEMKEMEEIYLGIDEVSFSGRDMICTITDVKERKVLGVLPSRKKSDLVKRLDELDIETLKKIKGIATDMNATYKKTVQEYIAKKTGVKVSEVGAKAVADHFHIVQMLMKRIMQVYRMNNWMIRAGHYGDEIQDICNQEIVNNQKYRTDSLIGAEEYIGEYVGYKPIQLGFFLSKSYVNLLCMKEEQHTNKQKDRLGQIFSEFDPCGYLKEAWIGKELLMKGIQEKSISMIDELISNYEKSKHYLLETTGRTLKKRREEIQNFFDLGITNAFTEGKNTKIKLFKRMAYGYIKKENYMKRILICL